MNLNNSGKIYRFNLDFDLGSCDAQLVDYSDISDFSGRLLYVYIPINSERDESNDIKVVEKKEILFGPIPLYKYPNIRGKGAWKYVGKTNTFIKAPPVFKKVAASHYDVKDWSKLKPWYTSTNFKERSDFVDYEKVRFWEIPVLHTTRDIEIRTTMHKILLSKRKVEEYYDLGNEDLRLLYLELINTCFKKKDTLTYLKSLR